VIQDIVAAQDDDLCPTCSQPVRTSRGVEVGNIFKLGTEYTDALGGHYLDRDGDQKPVIMGCYGIRSDRLLACILEEHHDDRGICFPISIAPYQVHMVAMLHRAPEVAETAERLYREAWDAGIEMLLDDREATPGVKFNDADLLGLPIRLTLGPRSLKQGAVEFKCRTEAESRSLPVDEMIPALKAEIERLLKESKNRAITMPFPTL